MNLLFLAYADHHKNLPAIQQEANTVYSLLTPGVAQGCYSIHPDRTATVDSIGEYLTRFRDNIFLFHYSGHAGDDIFHLEGENARAEGVAHLLGQCPNLKLVILNGCSTVDQVWLLRKAGVKATIIATHAPVEDIAAMHFASNFYQAFVGGDTVDKAFEQGIGVALMGSSISVHRGIDLENLPIEDNTPLWGIFTMPGNQGEEVKLPGVQQLHFPPLRSPGFFFGREEELSAITRQLADNQASAIAISGGPGIGKSALCLAALHQREVVHRFGARRFFVNCGGAASAEALIMEIGKALGLDHGEKLEEGIWNSLRRGRAMLAIDNAETTFANDPSGLESLLKRLAGLPELALILTIRGVEAPYGVDWTERPSLEPLDEEASAKVFLAIAEARFSGDPALPELLHELEGLPLAIVLMASQSAGEPDLKQLLQRWKQQKTDILTRGTGDSRATNIAISIELSLQSPRMTPAGLRVFSLLGQLPDGIAVSDLELLAPGDGQEGAKILATIGLARYSTKRLVTLAPIQEYASANYPPDKKDWERLMIHYLTIAEKGEEILDAGGDKILAQITEELGNICRILDITLEDEATIGFKAALELGEFIRSCGLGDTSLLRKALEKARELNGRNVEAHLLSGLGDIAFVKSDYPEAESLLKEALPLYEQLKDILGQANCLRNLGEIAFLQSGHDTAAVLLEQALALYEQTEDINSKAYCLRSLGDMAFFRSDYKKARHLLGRALELFEQEGDVLGRANCLSRLGDIALHESNCDQARSLVEQALELFKQTGVLLGQASSLDSLGDIALCQSDYDQARSFFEQAHKLYKQTGSLLGEANCLNQLGKVALNQSDYAQAYSLVKQAMELYEKIGDPQGIANSLSHLGDIAFLKSDYAEARSLFDRAIGLYEKTGYQKGKANCLRSLGDIWLAEGNRAQAKEKWEAALKLYRNLNALNPLGVTYKRLAGLGSLGHRVKSILAAIQVWEAIGRHDLVQEMLPKGRLGRWAYQLLKKASQSGQF